MSIAQEMSVAHKYLIHTFDINIVACAIPKFSVLLNSIVENVSNNI